MERPVDHARALRLPAHGLEGLAEVLARVLGGEVDVGGHPAGGRRAAAGREVVGGAAAAGVEREVGVGVDDARKDVKAAQRISRSASVRAMIAAAIPLPMENPRIDSGVPPAEFFRNAYAAIASSSHCLQSTTPVLFP